MTCMKQHGTVYPPEAFQENGSQNSRIVYVRSTRGPRTAHSHGNYKILNRVCLYIHISVCEDVMNTFCSRPLRKLTPTGNSESLVLYLRDRGLTVSLRNDLRGES